MGCSSSRAKSSKLVALCRERKELIRAAVDRRYALAEAHAAYLRALAAVGDALHGFVEEELTMSSSPPGSPVLILPSSEGKLKPDSKAKGSSGDGGSGSVSSSVTPLSHSLSLSSDHAASPKDGGNNSSGGSGGAGGEPSSTPPMTVPSPNHSFMRSSTAVPTMVYDDPFAPRPNSAYSGHGYGSYGYGNGSGNGLGYQYPLYGDPIGYSPPPRGGGNSYYDDRSAAAAPGTPPPPPPPANPAWEFFNFFDTYEQFLPDYSKEMYGVNSYAGSPNSSEVREQEGIPDLEEETESEPMKEMRKEKKKMANEDLERKGSSGKGSSGKDSSVGSSKIVFRSRKNAAGTEDKENESSSNSGKLRNSEEDEGSNGRKKGVAFDYSSYVTEESGPSNGKSLSEPRSGKPLSPSNGKSLSALSTGKSLLAHGTRDVLEVVKEIMEEFEAAADYGKEVSRMLEVGKLRYRSRSKMCRVISSRVLDPLTLPISHPSGKRSRHSATSLSNSRASNGDSYKHMGMKSGNLSSTLEKLYVWEKRLYKEVKAEEILRDIYDKKFKHIRTLDNAGAESDKIDNVRASLRKLRTRLSIIIKSVDAISRRMHKIRDEELQPQLIELIQGFMRMWKSLLDCHQKQLRAIVDSQKQRLMTKTGSRRNSVAKATIGLEQQLMNWYHCFSDWISTQKAYVEALNGWLIKWLPQEQEETPDGVAPFSPSRIEAPAVFIISNDWFHATKMISEEKVTEEMRKFAAIVHKLWESQYEEHHRKLKVDYLSKVYDTRQKSLQESGVNGHMDIVSVAENDPEHHDDRIMALNKIRKRLEEERVKLEETVQRVQAAGSGILRTGLIPIFEALETFTSETLEAYKRVRISNGTH